MRGSNTPAIARCAAANDVSAKARLVARHGRHNSAAATSAELEEEVQEIMEVCVPRSSDDHQETHRLFENRLPEAQRYIYWRDFCDKLRIYSTCAACAGWIVLLLCLAPVFLTRHGIGSGTTAAV